MQQPSSEVVPTAVWVTNISPDASKESTHEFFNICGPISTLILKSAANGTSNALVEFETAEAAKTALFLNDTLVIDRAIQVVPYSPAVEAEAAAAAAAAASGGEGGAKGPVPEPDVGAEGGEKKPAGFFMKAATAAYSLSASAVEKAKQLDEKHGISAGIKGTAQGIDQKLGLSDKARVVGQKLDETSKKVDASLGISEKLSSASEAAKQRWDKAQENPTVAKVVGVGRVARDNVDALMAQAIARAKKTIREIKGEPEETPATEMEELVDEPVEAAKAAAEDVVEDVVEATEDAVDAAAETVSEVLPEEVVEEEEEEEGTGVQTEETQ